MTLTYLSTLKEVENTYRALPPKQMENMSQVVLERLSELGSDIQKLEASLYHNGGDGLRGSIRENTVKIDKVQAELTADIDKVGTKVDSIINRMKKADDEMAERVKSMRNTSRTLILSIATAAILAGGGAILNGFYNSQLRAIADQIQQNQQVQQVP